MIEAFIVIGRLTERKMRLEVRLGEARNQTLVILVIWGTIVLAVVISG